MMSDGERLTRLRKAFFAAPPSDRPRSDCPPARTLWEGARGELSPTDLRETLHHVAACPVCTEAWRLAAKLEEGAEDGLDARSEETVPPRRWSGLAGWRSVGTLAAAATLILVVGLSWQQGDEAPVLRGAGGETSGCPEIQLSVSDPLPRDQFLLRWCGPEDAEYELTIAAASAPLKPLVEVTGLRASEYRVAAEDLASLPPNSRLQIFLKSTYPVEVEGRTFYVEVR